MKEFYNIEKLELNIKDIDIFNNVDRIFKTRDFINGIYDYCFNNELDESPFNENDVDTMVEIFINSYDANISENDQIYNIIYNYYKENIKG